MEATTFRPVRNERPVDLVGDKKTRRTAVGGYHAFFHQFLGKQFFRRLDTFNLLFFVQNPAEFLAILHHQIAALAPRAQRPVYLVQGFQRCGVAH